MAGHSKWANIKHRKAAQDKKRGKVWTKLIREVTIAARASGGDPSANPRLRLAMDKALAANMPRDTIDRAIKRGVGSDDAENYEDIRYEGYGPGGVAVMVDCMTDNRNRTASEVRHAFTKYGGNLGTDGSVGYLFTKQGVISFQPGTSEDAVIEAALDAGADDVVVNEDGSLDVITAPDLFAAVCIALSAAGLDTSVSEVSYNAAVQVALDRDSAEKLLKMIDLLDDLDDVQDVYHNADISDDLMAELDG